MDGNEKGNSIIGGFFWRFGERILAQLVTFVVSLVIARILDPSAYGMISILMVFIALADIFVTSGFGNALVQKRDSDNLDFSSVFYFNIVLSIILYAIIWAVSPTIERWYGGDYAGLSTVLRVLALRIPISAINNVQHAYVQKKMIFKRFFFATLGGTIGASFVGVLMAVSGFGVWALVAQYLFNTFVDTVVLWFTVKWRPTKAFSFIRLIELIKYGWKLLASQLLETIYNDMRTLLIGKMYSPNDLAYYNRGRQFPGLVVDNVSTSILSVMFPALCDVQDDKNRMRQLVHKSVSVTCYVLTPLLFGLAAVADKLVFVLLTEKWMSAVWFLRIFCFIFLLQPVIKPIQQVIKAVGRSDWSLYLQITSKTIGIIALLISIPFGVRAIAIAHAITSVIAAMMDMFVGGKIINYSLIEQSKAMLKPWLYAAPMLIIIVFPLNSILLNLSPLLVLVIDTICGSGIYIILSVIFKDESLKYILSCASNILQKKPRK